MILTPRHIEALVESSVESEEAHTAQDVSCTCFTRCRTTPAPVSSHWIAEQISRLSIAAPGRVRLDGSNRNCPASHVPVRGPATDVDRRTYRKSAVVTGNRSQCPST